MNRLFGSDGLRNIAVTHLTCELMWKIGCAISIVLDLHTGEPPVMLIGKDTRISSDILEASLCAGICSGGGNAVRLGVIPTPAVAYLIRNQKADAGMMITASYHPVEYNGLRLFSRNGLHMSDQLIGEIESLVLDKPEELLLHSGKKLGRMSVLSDSRELYLQHLQNCIDGSLNGMKIVLDCANGSTSETAYALYTRLGAEVTLLNAQPDGWNINQNCGSLHMEGLMNFIQQNPEFDAGLSFDGDGDRCLAVNESGILVDGDEILAVLAEDYQQQGKLKYDAMVMTVVSNLGLTEFARDRQIRKIISNIGDRFILEQMQENGCVLGGEQNGHILFLEDAPTGDGQLTGARLLSIMNRKQSRLSQLTGIIHKFPSVMFTVPIPDYSREIWKNDKIITDLIEQQESLLGHSGRILVRESSSESLIRVIAEGNDFQQINQIATEIADKIDERITENFQ